MINRKIYLLGFFSIVSGLLFFSLPTTRAQAASLFFSPSTITRDAGQTFSASIRVNTDGQSVNATQVSVAFDETKVEVVSVSKAGSILNLWTQEPNFSNSLGTIKFEGGLPNPGYTGSSGLLLTVSFRTKTATTIRGSTTITLVSGAILANDGQGTNILTGLGALNVVITPTAIPASQPESTPTTSQESGPKVESSTHPDSMKWYPNNNPSFNWELPTDVTGVSYLITDKANSNPGSKSDGIISKAEFTGVADGTQYFNIKFRENGVWGLITHYKFNIDTTPPAAFDIKTISTDPINPEIIFEATDGLSGIDHYEIKIGDSGDWVNLSADQAGKPYLISFDRIGTQTVFVKAVDKAGNTTIESTPVSITSLAVGSTVGTWLTKLFDGIVNTFSNYGLLIALLLALIGLLILIYQFLGTNIDKLWHRLDNQRVIKKTEHKIDGKYHHILGDMEDEIKFLDTIGKRRPLSTDEKYLKSKLQQYIKGLKDGGR